MSKSNPYAANEPNVVRAEDSVKTEELVDVKANEAEKATTLPASDDTPIYSSTVAQEVPEGSIKEVLKWVGDDKDRAVQAITAENKSDKPRVTLVATLEEIVG